MSSSSSSRAVPGLVGISDPASGAISKASSRAAETAPSSSYSSTPMLTQAVRTLPSPEAQALRHAHPALLAALFAARFNAFVADPVSAMQSALPVVAVLQAAYTIICLPASGSQQRQGAATRKLRPGEKKKVGGEAAAAAAAAARPNYAVMTFVALVLSGASAFALHVLFVLCGAPFLTHGSHTFLCALHLSLLGLYPLFYTRGVAASDWHNIMAVRAPLDEASGGFLGAVVGAYFGAVPIPLDWDREWQKWPVTILCGIYAGYLVGKSIGGTWALGKRIADIEI